MDHKVPSKKKNEQTIEVFSGKLILGLLFSWDLHSKYQLIFF